MMPFASGKSMQMPTSGTLGALLSTAIWAAIAGAAWAEGMARLLGRSRSMSNWIWFGDFAGWALIVLIPQGARLWGPKDLVHRYLPHTLTVVELNMLVKAAAIAGLLGITFAVLYRRASVRSKT
jgi:hypothetical protein